LTVFFTYFIILIFLNRDSLNFSGILFGNIWRITSSTSFIEIEKEYDLKKFITGKKIIKINETIKNINSKNVEEKFMGVDVDK